MKELRSILFILLISVLLTASSYAETRRLCKVYYETENGWSQGYTMEVSFLTGYELNNATRSYSYSMFSNYCLIWFGKGEVAILKINATLFRSGNEFERDDFLNLFLLQSEIRCVQVNSEDERNWKIKAKEFINFIDPREQ
jgi:hypothetical protein